MPDPTPVFSSPDELKEAWTNYKAFLLEDARNWPKIQYVGKDGDKVTDYPVLPITMSGFYTYYFNTHGKYIEQYFTNANGLYDAYIGICRACKNERTAQQITGGMLGAFNASITQRLNNLKEQTDNTNTNNNITLLTNDPLSDEGI